MSGFEIDLTGVEALVGSMMQDGCKIVRQVDDKNKVWNAATSTYETQDGATIYEGPCNIWSSKQGSYITTEGGVSKRISVYYVEIPRDSDRPEPEDKVTITSVGEHGNPQMLNVEMLVGSLDLYSYSVSLVVKCEIREQVPE